VNRWKAETALLGNTIIWGASFVIVKGALAGVSPILFIALRFSLAALVLLVIFRRRSKPWRAARGDLHAGLLVGALLFLGFLLQTIGLQFTTPPKSAFLTGMTSVTVPLLAGLVYRIRPQRSEVLGLLTATAGMSLMTLEGPIGAINRGDVLTLGCAVAFAGHIVTLGHFSEKMSFEALSVIQVATAAVLAGALFWWVEPARVTWRPGVVAAILVTGLLGTALAFTVQAWAQQFTSSARTALIFTLEPLFAWLTSYLFVGEGLSGRAAAGAALILGGVLLVETKPLNPRLHPSEWRLREGRYNKG
jgi:drug/metabolite transporter (DMT)-like permease